MKIVVAIKQVPERDAQIAIAADGRWIDDSDLVTDEDRGRSGATVKSR